MNCNCENHLGYPRWKKQGYPRISLLIPGLESRDKLGQAGMVLEQEKQGQAGISKTGTSWDSESRDKQGQAGIQKAGTSREMQGQAGILKSGKSREKQGWYWNRKKLGFRKQGQAAIHQAGKSQDSHDYTSTVLGH